jgi:hypothetical protein
LSISFFGLAIAIFFIYLSITDNRDSSNFEIGRNFETFKLMLDDGRNKGFVVTLWVLYFYIVQGYGYWIATFVSMPFNAL